MKGQPSGSLSSKVEISVVQKTSNKELNMSNIMSDAPFPRRVIVQDLCYKSIKALGSYSLRVKNHLLSNMLYFLGENSLGTI